MAPRRNPKSGSPGPGARRETKHGGSKNGKKEGLSGSSFFTWFMVIALLGVWTSVAVVWFELVDYEEVLAKAKDFRYNLSEVLQGKLGIYDADGDGDFDVDDAKILLGLKERSVPEHPTQPPPKDAEEVIKAAEQPHAEPEHVYAEPEPEDEIESLLREVLKSQLDETGEDNVNEETPFLDEEENNEISDETVEAPTLEQDYDDDLDYTVPEIVETPEMPESLQEEPASDHQPEEPEQDETHDSYEIHSDMKEGTHEPDTYESEGTEYREFTLEDALEHNTEPLPEGTEQHDYVEEHNLENEVLIETQGIDGEPLTEHYRGNAQDEEVASDMVTEHTESGEKEQANIHMTEPPRERDIPVQAEDYSNDNFVDT